MTHQVGPMVQRQRLRTDLQQVRLRLGLTQRQVAADLGWSVSKLLRVENGKVGVSRTDLKALLQCYGITDPEVVDGYVTMAAQGRKQRWSAYRDVLNPQFFKYLEYEGSASSIRQFQPHVIPGLLQTEAYARYLGRVASGTPVDVLDRQMEVRTARQDRLDEVRLDVVLDEAVIRRCLGAEPSVAAEQVAHMRELAARPAVSVRVVPFARGPYRGSSTPFILLGFPDPGDGDLLFRENGTDSVATRGDPRRTTRFAELFDELDAAAVPVVDLLPPSVP
ncbi:helix-turn-helix transcriptional regulator [Virgisporangium ochraceum]